MKPQEHLPSGWKFYRFGDIARFCRELFQVDPTETYQELSLRLYGNGFEIRREVSGSALVADEMQRMKTGQLVTSIHQFRNGAIGIIPKELEGTILSKNFLVYDFDSSVVDAAFLLRFLTAPSSIFFFQANSTGSATPIYPKGMIEEVEIPLPPLAEQRRVVARVEELTAQIHAACTLRHQAAEEAEALFISNLGQTYQECVDAVGLAPINSFADIKGGKRLPAGERLSDERTPFPYIRVADMENHSVSPNNLRFVPLRLQPGIARYIIRSNDVYVTIAGTIGYPGTVPDALDGANLTENAAKLVFNDSAKIEKRFVVNMLRSPQVQEKFQQKQTVAAQPKLALHRIASTEIPLPPLPEQRRIVAELDALQAEMEALKRLQAETAAELDALLPSILDKAFKGEL